MKKIQDNLLALQNRYRSVFPANSPRMKLLIFILLSLLLLPALIAVRSVQNTRSNADEKKAIISCEKVDPSLLNTTAANSQIPQLVAAAQAADRNLDQGLRDYMHEQRQEEREKKKDKKESQKEKKRDQDRKQAQKQFIKLMALARKKAFIELMYVDPNNTLNLSKGDKQKEGYYLLEDNCKVTKKRIEGELTISINEYANKQSTTTYEIATDTEDITIHPTANITGLENIAPDSHVAITSYVVDEEMIVSADEPIQIQQAEQRGIGAERANSQANNFTKNHVSGQQKTLALFMDFEDVKAQNMHNNKNVLLTQIKDFYSQVSYGKVSYDITPTNSITYPMKLGNQCKLGGIQTVKKMLKHASQRINMDKYDHIILLAPFGGNQCKGYYGWASSGKRPIRLEKGKIRASLTVIDTHDEIYHRQQGQERIKSIGITVIHELGHGLRLNHANAYKCNSIDFQSTFKDCKIEEYGDYYNIMGWTGGYFSVPYLEYLGWLDSSQIKEVTEGSYTVSPLEGASNGIKGLKVPRGNDSYLYIEYRQPIGIDTVFSTYENTTVYDGALLYIVNKNKSKSNLIDMNDSGEGHYRAAVLPPQGVFTDPETKTTVYIKAKTTQGLALEVYPNGKFPTPTSPIIRFASPTPTVKISFTPTPAKVIFPTILPSLTPTSKPSMTPYPTVAISPSPAL